MQYENVRILTSEKYTFRTIGELRNSIILIVNNAVFVLIIATIRNRIIVESFAVCVQKQAVTTTIFVEVVTAFVVGLF